jgi:hypothetical protein
MRNQEVHVLGCRRGKVLNSPTFREPAQHEKLYTSNYLKTGTLLPKLISNCSRGRGAPELRA